ncbi:[FeFe] hydrogenase H-cluster maturation GTPase HydF [Anaerosacchariphilus polymeriproducens]|uniref:[FeFe] hydrogenase H-cluster maturation GTPase HydF n=1 Tax=Anaerosacchariphilus polymeriproducens TaxID=1812858 RepID=A0A371AZV4_9FIRM|nr:[FeFe] hydrogenase H-cluster maturation GTPase HydF [Anaerosacchariphilus polymeriproducens]RDU25097.1 [FeFe] hydrogenase H-cluster maturation GTPase HydF [Anaerosacchariphilus polymeriproducens]
MSLNSTPKADRVHIGIFGKRNAGKSSLINAITNQDLAIVSAIKGTTTDPVYKAMEILPLGPVVVIDTPGLDDTGELGELRIEKSFQVLNQTDIGVLIIDFGNEVTEIEEKLVRLFIEKKIPYIIVVNKAEEKTDLQLEQVRKMLIAKFSQFEEEAGENILFVSAKNKEGIFELKEFLGKHVIKDNKEQPLVGDLIQANDLVILVVPIDSAAPKGRLILPQQQVVRDVLDHNGIAVVCQETNLSETIESLGRRPKIVITDSQVFEKVDKKTSEDIMLTSFSILFARKKGDLEALVEGARAIENLQDGDTVLISEGCTHHRQCDDIGTVKLPRWIQNYTKKKLNFEFSSGTGFPEDFSKYALVVHCGACMLNEREVMHRIHKTKQQETGITNYGVLIAYIHGILERTLSPFKHIV